MTYRVYVRDVSTTEVKECLVDQPTEALGKAKAIQLLQEYDQLMKVGARQYVVEDCRIVPPMQHYEDRNPQHVVLPPTEYIARQGLP